MKPVALLLIAIGCFAAAIVVLVVTVLMARAALHSMLSTINEMVGAEGRAYQSGGERIYLTGVDQAGERIGFSGGPRWLSMRGGSCVNCHGPGGRGGIPIMMTRETAPDIRYSVLTGKRAREEGAGDDVFQSDAEIKRAITKGLDPDGGALTLIMPRWQMSEQDLDDLLAYLKELDKQP